ncbi:hypothetical protein GKC56_01375 [Neisseriaceae bacterium PsAf]|nr:hypothetical protein [Neisseriaceae bacterium PsAf]
MFTQSMRYLGEKGAVDNSQKEVKASAFGFAVGTKDFYQYMHKNKDIRQYLINEVNHPLNVMKNKNMVSINSCISIDLTGQVTSEGLGHRQISGTGGALDYVKGVNFAENGKSFMVVESTKTNKSGEVVSNILESLPEGTPVTVPRSEIDHVVTEYGLVKIKNLTFRQRAIALINIAHPSFRKSLASGAISKGLIKEVDLEKIEFETVVEKIDGEKVSYQLEDGICTITLNDEKSLNALDVKLQRELLKFLEKADIDSRVKVVILTGAGGSFSSGGNVKEMRKANTANALDQYSKLSTKNVGAVSLAIRSMLKPVIEKVRGSAAGAGMNIALACDFRIVAEGTKFIEAFVNIGLMPDAGGFSLLTSLVGPAKATELLYFGNVISAEEAKSLGLITELVSTDNLDEATLKFAQKLNLLPTESLRRMKDLINQVSYSNLPSSINREVEGQRALAQSDDFNEGMNAFIQKRKPYFQGK